MRHWALPVSRHDLDELPQADFFSQLTAETAEQLASWSGLSQELLAAARVEEVEGDMAHLEGSSPRGGSVAVDLPSRLLERQRIGPGDLVWVLSRVVGDAALVELLPAVRIKLYLGTRGLEFAKLYAGAFASLQLEESAVDESDGLTVEERSESAGRFRATVGGNLTMGEVAALQADAETGRLPRRPLHPAG